MILALIESFFQSSLNFVNSVSKSFISDFSVISFVIVKKSGNFACIVNGFVEIMPSITLFKSCFFLKRVLEQLLPSRRNEAWPFRRAYMRRG